MVKVSIIFKINDKEIKLTVDEAETVYQQLGKLFKTEKPIEILYPNPVYPYEPIYSNDNKE